MRIAQISPLYESVPPKFYGGTERIVSFLTEELVNQGHEVTLFASGDSRTKAKLISPCSRSLRLNGANDQLAHHFLMLEMIQQVKEDFDIIHYHIDYLHFPISRRSRILSLTTLHGNLSGPDLQGIFKEFSEMPLASISNSQRSPLPFSNWIETVYHGIPLDLLKFNPQGGEYLSFLGRISPEKRVDRAIEIAIACGIPLKIAAKIDNVDKEYFNARIKPLLDHPLIEYVGEIGEAEKSDFLGNSLALLFPIDWPEPFGLVMIEAMACGTPVVAFRKGSSPEVIDQGETGFLVDSVEEATSVVLKEIPDFDRSWCRQIFENRFSASRMAQDYLRCYHKLLTINGMGLTPALKEN